MLGNVFKTTYVMKQEVSQLVENGILTIVSRRQRNDRAGVNRMAR
jgi:hypothetical protein